MANDFADFTRAVAFRDSSSALTPGWTTHAPGTLPDFDVSQLQAVYLDASFGPDPAGTSYGLNIDFSDLNSVQVQRLHIDLLYGGYQFGGPGFVLGIPVQGQVLTITELSTGAFNWNLKVIGSSRPLPQLICQAVAYEPSGPGLAQDTVNVPAGGSIGPFTVPIVGRGYGVHVAPSDTHLTYKITAHRYTGGGGASEDEVLSVPGSAAGREIPFLPVALRNLLVTVTNSDAAPHPATITVWDAS